MESKGIIELLIWLYFQCLRCFKSRVWKLSMTRSGLFFNRLFIKLQSFDVSNWRKVDNYLPRMSIMVISDSAYSDNAMKNAGRNKRSHNSYTNSPSTNYEPS